MTIRLRERKRLAFAAMVKERGLTHAQAAEILHVSLDTMKSWLKPETSKSSYPVPAWAMELLGFKVPARDIEREKSLAGLKKRVLAHKARKTKAA